MDNNLLPYEGSEPYVFISYSHKDMDIVLPILQRLSDEKFRVWYDEGIDPGTEWPESIAEHLNGSQVCLAFISKNSISSFNCRREINYALSRNRGFLWVQIEPCVLSPGMELQLSSYQGLMSYTYPSIEKFYSKLLQLDILQSCRIGHDADPASDRTEDELPASANAIADNEDNDKKDHVSDRNHHAADTPVRSKKKTGLFLCLAAVALIAAIWFISSKLSGRDTLSGSTPPAGVLATEVPASALSEGIAESSNDSVQDAGASMSAAPTEISWTLESNTLTIRGTGPMSNYDNYSDYAPWYGERSNIQFVMIEPGVTSVGNWAFCGCDQLVQVSIPGSVRSIGYGAFDNCCSLLEIDIPEGVTSIGNNVFWNCFNLSSVTIPQTLTSIGQYPFCNCPSLSTIDTNPDNTAYTSSDGVLYDIGKTALICYPAKRAGQKYEIPDTVNKIGEGAFWGCNELVLITIPDSVTVIEESAFENCTNLLSVSIPDSVVQIGPRAFAACNSITQFAVGEENPAFSSVDGVLYNKDGSILKRYPGARPGSFIVPDSVIIIEDRAFNRSAHLTDVTIPENVISIGAFAFEDCTSLASIRIPDSVGFIANSSFKGCRSLKEVTIGSGVKQIETEAFSSCEKLTDIYYFGTETQWKTILIGSGNDALNNAEIHFQSK